MDGKHQILKRYFGHGSFRNAQENVIDSLINGRDALSVMPTGAGKSVCYQVPALLLDGITLVVSPLISLMKDQVAALIQMGISAAYINSSLDPNQVTKALEYAARGKYKIIYVAPERLYTWEFKRFCQSVKISLIAIDEAHCVSQWGPDFRPSYLKIADFIDGFEVRPVVGAFTATATAEVKKDILNLLKLKNPEVVTTGFDRPNLYFSVLSPKNKNQTLLSLLSERKDKSGIIYCTTRKNVENVCGLLTENGFSATRYHAGLEDDERRRNQDDFVYDRKQIMVATNAFGMGIDKSDVAFVIHYNMPKDLEGYYQEAGRAGRDGGDADCILLYSTKDVATIKYFIENPNENEDLTQEEQELLKDRQYERLEQMIKYCTTRECLRNYILKYFGDDCGDFCGKCGNCLSNFELVDVTVDAQKIMSCVIKTGQKYGKRMITDVLRGRGTKRLLECGLETQSTYGIMADYSKDEIYNIIDGLIFQGYMQSSADQYSVLKVLPRSHGVLYGNEKIEIKLKKNQAKQAKGKKSDASYDVDGKLFIALKVVRTYFAKKANVPAFVIFSDATLIDMCRKKPTTKEEFLEVSGVGEIKYERYGKAFIEAIKRFGRE